VPSGKAESKTWKKVRELEEPEWWEHNTAALVWARLEEAAFRVGQLSARIQAFVRRQDPDRELVYFDILCVWERALGRKLTFSRDAYSDQPEPTGDLITYFEWAANFMKRGPGATWDRRYHR
jgi:hypothetical protein